MNIYCSGIGGIGLSAYASLQSAHGHTVQGSDRSTSVVTTDLENQGIKVFLNQDGSHVSDSIDLFVYSEAIPDTSPERLKATELGIDQKTYFEALGQLSKDKFVIAVCGTHGKSTTTALATVMLNELEIKPTIVVGTRVKNLENRNWQKGESDTFLVEACEYRGSFHNLSPNIILMTNVDGDHFDAFGTLEEYQNAYVDFLKQLPDDGVVITHMNDSDCARIAKQSGKKSVDADAIAQPVLPYPGQHMVQNAQLVLALAQELNLDPYIAEHSLANYKGAWRRMEEKGKTSESALVIDDYAHHPKETEVTIAAVAQKYSNKRIIGVFQPHTHDRTRQFYDQFTSKESGFHALHTLIIPNIYDARSDIESGEIDVDQFIEDIKKGTGTEVIHGESLQKTEEILHSILQEGDVLLVMGAGDITNLASAMVSLKA